MTAFIYYNSRKCKLIYIDRKWLLRMEMEGEIGLQKSTRELSGVMYGCYLDCGDSLMCTEIDLRASLKILTPEVRI